MFFIAVLTGRTGMGQLYQGVSGAFAHLDLGFSGVTSAAVNLE
jgi:hypothetical protein